MDTPSPVFEFVVPVDTPMSEEALAYLSHLRLERGQFISVCPGDPNPVEVVTQYPANYGALLGALMVGAIVPADGTMPPAFLYASLLRCVGAPPPRPDVAPPRLRVLK